MSKKFICQIDGENWYLSDKGMGGFLTPPGHAMQSFSIVTKDASYSLEAVVEYGYIPDKVKEIAKDLLEKHTGNAKNEAWIKSVYTYFKHCYSPDGENRNANDAVVYGKFWGNAELEKDVDPYTHLAYLYIKKYDASHTPRMDLIEVSK